MMAEETAMRPLVLTQAPVIGLLSQPAAPPVSSKPSLRFDFAKLQGASQPTQANVTPKLDIAPTRFATPLNNPFEASKESNNRNVMRLTAVVDDLQARLKKATDRAVTAETQLHKTHATMLEERKNAAERVKAAAAQLGEAHATESQLRSDLSKVAKASAAPIQPKTKSFDSAVVAVMTAERADERADEKKHKEMDMLNSKILAQDVESKHMASQIIKLQADSARANDRSNELHKQFSAATHELSVAREAERCATEECQKLSIELQKAEVALQKTIEAEAETETQASEAATPAAHAEAIEEEIEVSKAKVAAEADRMCPSQMEMACCPKCDTDLVASVDEHLHIDNAPSTEVPVPIAVAMDPIKTHVRYSRLREKAMSLAASIARLQCSNQDDELLPAMIEKRNDLYKRAKALKTQYDTVFGTVEPDSVVKLSGMESFVAPKAADTIDARKAEEAYYAPVGDAPGQCMTYTISFARMMARNCPVEGAFDFGTLDCGVAIGKAAIKPITRNGVVIGDDAAKDSEPTESHDARDDMVTAVVRDLTRYLKHVKEKEKEEDVQSTKEAMDSSYA